MYIYFMSISSSSNSMWQKALQVFLRLAFPYCSPGVLTNLLLSGPGHRGCQGGGVLGLLTLRRRSPRSKSLGQGQGRDCRIKNIKNSVEEGKQEKNPNGQTGRERGRDR